MFPFVNSDRLRYERRVKEVKDRIAEVNLKRSLQQSTAAKELNALEEEWYATTVKCIQIDGAVQALEEELAAFKDAAKE